ncbi:MAG: EamA family transporter [Eubacteriaceae bacterium]
MINHNQAILFYIFLVFISACAQILLKHSTRLDYHNVIKRYLNHWTMIAYSIFVINTIGSIYCLRFLDLKLAGVLQMFSYVFVIILGRLFLKERITTKKILGIIMVILGILIFYQGGLII